MTWKKITWYHKKLLKLQNGGRSSNTRNQTLHSTVIPFYPMVQSCNTRGTDTKFMGHKGGNVVKERQYLVDPSKGKDTRGTVRNMETGR